jgi:hypothetical protein
VYLRTQKAFRSGDRENLEEIIKATKIRRLILNSTESSSFFNDGLTERQILDVLTLISDSDFNLRDNLGTIVTIEGIYWALKNKHYELYRFLWGSTDLLNVWTYDAF